MSLDLKSNFKSNIKNQDKETVPEDNIKTEDETSILNTKFVIGKKQEDKADKKSFPLYMEPEKIKNLDKVCKKTNYSRNELINMMIDFCMENIEYTD